MPSPHPRHMPARPFKPKPRALWLPLLAFAAVVSVALFLPPTKSFDAGHSAVPVTAADAFGIKDWTPVSGEIDTAGNYLTFTYGRGAFNQYQTIGLKGKFTIDGKYAPWVGKGFYRVLATGAEEKFAEWYNANGIRSIAFSADGALVLAGGEWTDHTLLDVKTGRPPSPSRRPASALSPAPWRFRQTARSPWSARRGKAHSPSTISKAFPA